VSDCVVRSSHRPSAGPKHLSIGPGAILYLKSPVIIQTITCKTDFPRVSSDLRAQLQGAMGKGSRSSSEELMAAAQQAQQQAVAAAVQGAQAEQQHQQQATLPPDALLALPQYQPFQATDFNAAEFTSRVLTGSRTSAHAQAEELRQGVRQLEAALASAVVSNHSALLGHARRLLDAETGTQEVAVSVGTLQSAVRRVRAEVEGPYMSVLLKTRQLRALHATIELLRALLLRLKLTAKLRVQLDAPPGGVDLAKAAKLLADVTGVPGGDGLGGVALAAADTPFLEAAGASIREQAQVGGVPLRKGKGMGAAGGEARGCCCFGAQGLQAGPAGG
jgi:hypothetical protein